MTQPSDNVYLSISFPNVPRDVADKIRAAAEAASGDYDISVDYGDPIGADSPTPVADEAAAAVAQSAPVDSTVSDAVTPAEPTDTPVLTAVDTEDEVDAPRAAGTPVQGDPAAPTN